MAETLIDNDQSEHYIKRGDPSKPTYYIIRPQYFSSGLFWHFAYSVGHIRYALQKGWCPVVDLQNYPIPYLSSDKLGKENAWEYYFEQPSRISLEEAFEGENVLLSCRKSQPMRPDPSMQFTEKNLSPLRNLVKQGVLKVKPEISEEVSILTEKLFAPTDRVLGVKLRGTDYIAHKPKYHCIPPPYN